MKNLKFPLKPGKCEKVPIKDLFQNLNKGTVRRIVFIYLLDIILHKITSYNSITS